MENWEKVWSASVADLLIHDCPEIRALTREYVRDMLEIIERVKEKEQREAVVR